MTLFFRHIFIIKRLVKSYEGSLLLEIVEILFLCLERCGNEKLKSLNLLILGGVSVSQVYNNINHFHFYQIRTAGNDSYYKLIEFGFIIVVYFETDSSHVCYLNVRSHYSLL